MALAITHLIDGTITSNGGSTGTITATAGARVLITVGGAGTGGSTITDCAISGGGVTWAIVGQIEGWASRRSTYILMSSSTPSSGTVTITLTVTGTFEQIKYSVDEITGYDNTTPVGTAYTEINSSATSAPVTVSQTPDAGDMVFYAAGLENNNTPSLGSELDTTLISFGDTTGCRRLIVAYDSAPDSAPVPSVTWSPACGTGAVAFIINVAAAGGTPVPVFMHHLNMMARN